MKRILKKVAEQNDVSVKEVRKEISLAIHEAMKTTDPNAQNLWKCICKNGKESTPEELIAHIIAMIKM